MDAIFIWSSALVICVGLPLFFTVINVIRLFENAPKELDRPLFDVLTVVIGSLLSVFDLDGLGLGVEYDVPLTVHGEFHTPISGEYRFSFFLPAFYSYGVHCTVECYNKEKTAVVCGYAHCRGVYGQCA